MRGRFAAELAVGLVCAVLQGCTQAPQPIRAETKPLVAPPPQLPPVDNRSGRTQVGKASYYAPKFDGRTMADGTRYSPEGSAAASKTLPLGTTAKVTNLDTGKSAMVQVQDRGPRVDGRIIDVSPKAAEKLDMKHAGVAPVEVKPVAVPHKNGTVTLGTGAAETPPQTVEQAVKTTERLAPDLQ